MLVAESVPVWKVSRPRDSGRWSSSRVRISPLGRSSAMSMRIPLAPTSMTDITGGPAGTAGTAAGTGGIAWASATGHHHRLESELILEKVALVLQRPRVEAHVPARAHPELQLRAALLRAYRAHVLLVVVIEGVRHAKDGGERTDPLLILLVERGVRLVARVGRRLPVIARDVRHDLLLRVA